MYSSRDNGQVTLFLLPQLLRLKTRKRKVLCEEDVVLWAKNYSIWKVELMQNCHEIEASLV